MNVDRLRAVQSEEREADSLRPLPDAFYREVADYIAGLREERAAAAEAAEDPFGAEDVRRLTDEIETAEEVAEAIYERRVGKLVKRASLAAAGMPVDEEGLTTEEAELFVDLVALIEDHREGVFETFGRPGDAPAPQAPTGTDDPAAEPSERTAGSDDRTPASTDDLPDDDEREPADDTGGGAPDDGDEASSAPHDDGGSSSPSAEDPDRVTLRITRDVGEVFGVDERVYDLAAEDVVTLPAPNAKPLLERDAAEEID